MKAIVTATGVWLPFSLSAYNAGTDPRYATIRITAKTAAAGAFTATWNNRGSETYS